MNKKTEKFLFNQHIFDEPDIEDEVMEEAPPPPPTFSEAELETVRRATHDRAYEQGKAEGIAQERASIEAQIAQALAIIEQQAALIFAAEHERERVFEQETLVVTQAILEKLFPAYARHYGFEELKAAISDILQKQDNQSEITIEVHPELVEGIRAYILSPQRGAAMRQRFDIQGNDGFSPAQCALYWKDGGAVRNTEKIAQEIERFIQQTLAAHRASVHDSEETGGTLNADAPVHNNDANDIGDTANASAQNADNNTDDNSNDSLSEAKTEAQLDNTTDGETG